MVDEVEEPMAVEEEEITAVVDTDIHIEGTICFHIYLSLTL